MLLRQTLLIFVISLIGYNEYALGTSLLARPIVLGAATGAAMGDLTQGIIIGGTLELAFIGAISIGAYIPPDMVSGAVLGTAFAIAAGTGPETALALGLPISTVMLAAKTAFGTPLTLALVHVADAKAAEGDVKGLERWYWVAALTVPFILSLIVPTAFYFGSDVVQSALATIPEWLQTGINLSGGLIPALGFAMLAQMIMSRKVVVFFFMGFFMVQYLGIDTTAVAIFGGILAFVLATIEHRINRDDGLAEEEAIDEF